MTALPSSPGVGAAVWADAADHRRQYNVSEAAALLGVSRVSVWRWIRAGRLPAARLGHRTVRIEREDLQRIAARGAPGRPRPWRVRDPAAWAGTDEGDGAAPALRPAARDTGAREHLVQFYEADAFLVGAAAAFIWAALRAGGAGIVVATADHRAGIEARLRADGLDVGAARAAGRYVALDAAATLARFMVDGAPDPGRFQDVIGGIVARAAAGGRPLRVFGEMVALLAVEGNHAAALRLEQLWNELQTAHAFSLLCAYPKDRPGGDALARAVGDACAEHSCVVPPKSYAALPTPDARRRAIVVLQQHAQSLEAALASERAARRAAEAALRLRDEFLSIAAHELKTALAALVGTAQLVLRRLTREGHPEPERVAQALQVLTSQGDRLSRLIDRLLDVSRLEAGKLPPERGPTDLAALGEDETRG